MTCVGLNNKAKEDTWPAHTALQPFSAREWSSGAWHRFKSPDGVLLYPRILIQNFKFGLRQITLIMAAA